MRGLRQISLAILALALVLSAGAGFAWAEDPAAASPAPQTMPEIVHETPPAVPGMAGPLGTNLEHAGTEAVGEYQADGAAHKEKKKGLPQLDVKTYPSQIFWLLVTFGFLYFFFARAALPTIEQTVAKRRAKIESDLSSAQFAKEKAEAARNIYEKAASESQIESGKIFLAAESEAKATAAAALEDLRHRSETMLEEAEHFIEKARKEAMDGIHAAAAEIASLAASRIIGIQPDIEQAKSVIENIHKKAA